jgi:hypothetical protein
MDLLLGRLKNKDQNLLWGLQMKRGVITIKSSITE